MTIYLIRHTEVTVGRSICYGGSDVDLTDQYDVQLARIRTHLTTPPNAIWSSPLSRCQRLALDLAGDRQVADFVEVNFDERLREYHFGDWELCPWADLPPDELKRWRADFVRLAPPNGETFQALADRVRAFWEEIILPMAQDSPSDTVYVVSHGGVIRTLLCIFLDLSLQSAYRLHLDYGAVCQVTITNRNYQVGYINR